jgi:hypothetical protein
MDYVNGGTLFHWMREVGLFTEAQARFFAAELLLGAVPCQLGGAGQLGGACQLQASSRPPHTEACAAAATARPNAVLLLSTHARRLCVCFNPASLRFVWAAPVAVAPRPTDPPRPTDTRLCGMARRRSRSGTGSDRAPARAPDRAPRPQARERAGDRRAGEAQCTRRTLGHRTASASASARARACSLHGVRRLPTTKQGCS